MACFGELFGHSVTACCGRDSGCDRTPCFGRRPDGELKRSPGRDPDGEQSECPGRRPAREQTGCSSPYFEGEQVGCVARYLDCEQAGCARSRCRIRSPLTFAIVCGCLLVLVVSVVCAIYARLLPPPAEPGWRAAPADALRMALMARSLPVPSPPCPAGTARLPDSVDIRCRPTDIGARRSRPIFSVSLFF